MADPVALFGHRLRGADVHAAIDEHRVDRDDLRVLLRAEPLRERDPELGLSRRGRSDERAQRAQERTPGVAVRSAPHQIGTGAHRSARATPLR
jgi:hypothetical protein